MTPAQFNTERERLGFTQEAVADMADLSLETVRDFEEGRPVNASLIDALRVTLESLGANFFPVCDHVTAAVRLAKNN